ncbi:hypothetical protein JCM11251_000185 [Rhodosporidiobolus azoricus]
MHPTVALLLAPLLYTSFTTARTISFDDQDDLLVYSPKSAWRISSDEREGDWLGGTASLTGRRGATFRTTFAGEQISFYGSSFAAFTVSIDGIATSSAESSPAGGLDSTNPVRIFLANELDRETVHRLILEVSGEGTLKIDRVAVAYANDLDLVPALLPNGTTGAVSTATLSPSSTSSASTSPASEWSAPSSLPTTKSEGNGRGPAIVAGIIVGSAAAVALGVFAVFFFLRRRRKRVPNGVTPVGKKRSSYHNADTGAPHRRRSTLSGFLSAINLSSGGSAHPLPLARAASPTYISRSEHDSRRPHPYASPLAGSSTHRSCLPDRLEATTDFYGVPNIVRGPPPAGPLPAVPGRGPSEEREMEQRWRTEGPSLVASSRAPSRAAAADAIHEAAADPPMTVQVFGEAMSDYAASDEAHAPTESCHSRRVSAVPFAQSSSGVQYLRRRSWRQEEGGNGAPGEPFSVQLAVDDMPLQPLPPIATAVGRARAPKMSGTSFRNPFSSSTSTTGSHSHSNSLAHSTLTDRDPHPRAHPRLSTSSSDAEHASVEGAEIVAVSAMPSSSPDDEDTPLYSHGVGLAPVRMSSLRELHDTVRAGPRGDMNRNEVVKNPASVARRPTLTRREGTGGSERSGSVTPRPPTQATVRPEDVVPEGYEEEEVVLSDEERAKRHQSVAALIETVESSDDLLDESNASSSRGSKSLRDPPPGEEDRSAFFARRERMPRYSADGGDPRKVEWGDGSISRR